MSTTRIDEGLLRGRVRASETHLIVTNLRDEAAVCANSCKIASTTQRAPSERAAPDAETHHTPHTAQQRQHPAAASQAACDPPTAAAGHGLPPSLPIIRHNPPEFHGETFLSPSPSVFCHPTSASSSTSLRDTSASARLCPPASPLMNPHPPSRSTLTQNQFYSKAPAVCNTPHFRYSHIRLRVESPGRWAVIL